MTPPARVQATIELLDLIIVAARDGGPAADTIIADYFRTRRYAGSGDRRAVRELVYRAIRRSGERPSSGRAALLGLADEDGDLLACFDGSGHGPAAVSPEEEQSQASVAPAWLSGYFDPLIDEAEQAALLERAPLDLRVNRLKGTREQALAGFPDAAPSELSPIGLRLPASIRVEEHPAFRSGLVEVQDEGSQWLALACEAQPGMLAIDLCAGAGGKTLALAAGMANQGRIVASDVDRGRLGKMRPRLERAGVAIVTPLLLDPGREIEALGDLRGAADLVLIDAPCSGTGTWRRNPEARWRLDDERLRRLTTLQEALLDLGAQLVRPGGRLVYAVCSLLAVEGRDQARAFGVRSGWNVDAIATDCGRVAGDGRLLSPLHDRTDGFFVARWRAP